MSNIIIRNNLTSPPITIPEGEDVDITFETGSSLYSLAPNNSYVGGAIRYEGDSTGNLISGKIWSNKNNPEISLDSSASVNISEVS